MGLLGNLLNGGSQAKELLANGAVIVDVRTPQEFTGGNVKGSKNIPLAELDSNVEKIKSWNKPVVLCCASGMRSGQATRILKSAGVECTNGGGWLKVNGLVNQ